MKIGILGSGLMGRRSCIDSNDWCDEFHSEVALRCKSLKTQGRSCGWEAGIREPVAMFEAQRAASPNPLAQTPTGPQQGNHVSVP